MHLHFDLFLKASRKCCIGVKWIFRLVTNTILLIVHGGSGYIFSLCKSVVKWIFRLVTNTVHCLCHEILVRHLGYYSLESGRTAYTSFLFQYLSVGNKWISFIKSVSIKIGYFFGGCFSYLLYFRETAFLIQSTNVWGCSDKLLKFSNALLQSERKSISRLVQQGCSMNWPCLKRGKVESAVACVLHKPSGLWLCWQQVVPLRGCFSTVGA